MIQVTLPPSGTWSSGGEKLKLSIRIASASPTTAGVGLAAESRCRAAAAGALPAGAEPSGVSTIASADQRFRASSALDTNDHYTLTFARPGTYRYFCTLHPKMTGRVVVG